MGTHTRSRRTGAGRHARMAWLLTMTALVAASAAAAQDVRGGEPPPLPLLPGSAVFLEGRTNVHPYRCRGTEVAATVRMADVERAGSLEGTGEGAIPQVGPIEVSVPVAALRCGNGRMERDLQRALRASEHPAILFRLADYHLRPDPARPDRFIVEARGELEVAGVARSIVLPVEGTTEPGEVRIGGGQEVRMTDFGVTPPTALLGVIRAADRVDFRFDLAASTAALASYLGTDEATLLRRLGYHAGRLATRATEDGSRR